jgi:membrane associated rhomboid family serine protease
LQHGLAAIHSGHHRQHPARQTRGRVNHDAHLAGALAGVAFVALTDPAAVARAWRLVFG